MINWENISDWIHWYPKQIFGIKTSQKKKVLSKSINQLLNQQFNINQLISHQLKSKPLPSSSTSWYETDGAEESGLGVVHLDGQQLVGEGEDQVSQRPEARVVHLGPVQGQSVREGHCVLIGGVASADTQDLPIHTHTHAHISILYYFLMYLKTNASIGSYSV